jgi:thymidylate synthase
MVTLASLKEKWRINSGYYLFTKGNSLSEVTHKVLRKLTSLPDSQASRVGNTKELTPHQFHIAADAYGEPNPTTLLPGRGNNPFATIAETLWVYAGRNDITTLSKWLPRAVDYSDDNRTWTSGYGPRIIKWGDDKRPGNPVHALNQIEMVIRRLKKNPNSRQAVIVIWDPASDGVKEGSKDYVCNLHLQFLIRDRGLNMYVNTRSNDIIFGVAINVFEWCFLGQYVAETLDIPFRNYYQTGASLHLYDWKGETAKKVVRDEFIEAPFLRLAKPREHNVITPRDLQTVCNQIYNSAYAGTLEKFNLDYLSHLPSRIRDFYWALIAETYLERDHVKYLTALSFLEYPPLVLSLLDIGMRRLKKPLWLCNGFPEIWKTPADEAKARDYLARVYTLHNS